MRGGAYPQGSDSAHVPAANIAVEVAAGRVAAAARRMRVRDRAKEARQIGDLRDIPQAYRPVNRGRRRRVGAPGVPRDEQGGAVGEDTRRAALVVASSDIRYHIAR